MRDVVDHGEMDLGDVRKKRTICGGKCLWRKLDSHGSKEILLSLT